MTAEEEVIKFAASIARRLPETDVRSLSAATAAGPDALITFRAASSSATLRAYCDQVGVFMERVDPQFIAGAISAASHVHHATTGTVDVVWTGPQVDGTEGRLTLATVVDLIAQARHDILLVSYAAHSDPNLTAALHAAADRGVSITLLLERPEDNPSYKAYGTPFPGLRATRLAWPAGNREPGSSMHAKVLVIDDDVALVGSANLTSKAMETNLEFGLLVRGDPPSQIRRYFAALQSTGTLVALSPP